MRQSKSNRHRAIRTGALIVGGRNQVNKDHHGEQQRQDGTLKTGSPCCRI